MGSHTSQNPTLHLSYHPSLASKSCAPKFQDTISQPALKQYNKYPEVVTEALEWLRITDNHNISITIPTLPSFKQSPLLGHIEGELVTPKAHLQLEQFKPDLLHSKYHCLA
eukprot:15365787-Ditylum_brightwellii.AAC.1